MNDLSNLLPILMVPVLFVLNKFFTKFKCVIFAGNVEFSISSFGIVLFREKVKNVEIQKIYIENNPFGIFLNLFLIGQGRHWFLFPGQNSYVKIILKNTIYFYSGDDIPFLLDQFKESGVLVIDQTGR